MYNHNYSLYAILIFVAVVLITGRILQCVNAGNILRAEAAKAAVAAAAASTVLYGDIEVRLMDVTIEGREVVFRCKKVTIHE